MASAPERSVPEGVIALVAKAALDAGTPSPSRAVAVEMPALSAPGPLQPAAGRASARGSVTGAHPASLASRFFGVPEADDHHDGEADGGGASNPPSHRRCLIARPRRPRPPA